MRYLVVIEKGPTSYGAHVPDLPGCVAVCETEEETRTLIREAVELHLDNLRRHNDSIPPSTSRAFSGSAGNGFESTIRVR